MNQFDLARQKYEKNRERNQQYRETAEKKEEVKPEVKPEAKPERKAEPMVLHITGLPFPMTLEVDYLGTLTSGQVNEKNLRDMFRKCLLPVGRVR